MWLDGWEGSKCCNGRVVKALDSKSNGIFPRRFEPCSQRLVLNSELRECAEVVVKLEFIKITQLYQEITEFKTLLPNGLTLIEVCVADFVAVPCHHALI